LETQNTALGKVIAGGFWLMLGGFMMSLGGLAFWLVVSKLTTAEAVGYATTVFSIASVLSGVLNLGLNMAMLREVPERGNKALTSGLLLALVIGLISLIIAPLFAELYRGFNIYIPFVIIMTLMALTSNVALSTLIGCIKPFKVFTIQSIAIITRFGVGISLVVIGLSVLGIIYGIIAQMLIALLLSLVIVIKILSISIPSYSDFIEVLKIGVSNYPYTLSTQIVTTLSVILLAIALRNPSITGIFYIAMMITLAVSGISMSLLRIGLPISVSSGDSSVIQEGMRFGLSISTPIVVLLAIASRSILSLINPELHIGSLALTILCLSIVPSITVSTAITKLNSEKNLRMLIVVGLFRLVSLFTLMLLLSAIWGISGAATAYLMANLIALLPALRVLNGDVTRLFTKIYLIHIALILPPTILSIQGLIPGALASIISISIIILLKILTRKDMKFIIRSLMNTILRREIPNHQNS